MKTSSAIALLLLSLGLHTAHAYNVLDVASLNVNLPPGWKLDNISRKTGMVISTYTHTTTDTNQPESIVAVELTKEPGKDAYTAISEMTKNVYDQAINQQCEAEELVTPTQVDHPFKVWSQTFQCKPSASGIIQFYVDADPHTIYLITYTIPEYPFSAATRAKSMQMLTSSMQVCYKDTPCAPITN